MSLELLQAATQARLSKQESQVFLVLMSKTIGYKKWQDDIAMSQLVKLTQMRSDKINLALESLIEKGLIEILGQGRYGKIYAIAQTFQTVFFSSPQTRENIPLNQGSTHPKPENHTPNRVTDNKHHKQQLNKEHHNTLNLPPELSPQQKQQAQQQLKSLPQQLAQQCLTILKQALKRGHVKSIMAYFMSLIRQAKQSTLDTSSITTAKPKPKRHAENSIRQHFKQLEQMYGGALPFDAEKAVKKLAQEERKDTH